MPHLLFAGAVLVAAAVFALLEIEIEGRAGWASDLPTWRVENRWTRWFFGSRALTGYHLYVHLFVLVMVHLPFLLQLTPFSWRGEARIAAFLILFWVVEDFLWFVLNPEFGIHKFDPEHAWWHAPSWWWIAPREYWIFTPIALVLYLLSRA